VYICLFGVYHTTSIDLNIDGWTLDDERQLLRVVWYMVRYVVPLLLDLMLWQCLAEHLLAEAMRYVVHLKMSMKIKSSA
jgi:hypothetical protein